MNPEPKPSSLICSVCGQAWDKHTAGRTKPTKARPITVEDCVRVLKAELAARPKYGPNVWYGQGGIASSAAVPLYGNQLGKIS